MPIQHVPVGVLQQPVLGRVRDVHERELQGAVRAVLGSAWCGVGGGRRMGWRRASRRGARVGLPHGRGGGRRRGHVRDGGVRVCGVPAVQGARRDARDDVEVRGADLCAARTRSNDDDGHGCHAAVARQRSQRGRGRGSGFGGPPRPSSSSASASAVVGCRAFSVRLNRPGCLNDITDHFRIRRREEGPRKDLFSAPTTRTLGRATAMKEGGARGTT